MLLQSGWAGGTSGTVGSGAVAPTSWSFVSTGGTITYASALSGSGNSIRFVGTSERPGIQQQVSLANNVGATFSFSYNIETVTSGTIRLDNLTAVINATTTLTYYVNGVLVTGTTLATSNAQMLLNMNGSLRVGTGNTFVAPYQKVHIIANNTILVNLGLGHGFELVPCGLFILDMLF